MDGTNETRYVKCADEGDNGEVEEVGYSRTMHGEPVGTKTKQEIIDDLKTGKRYEVAVRKTDEWHTEKIHVHDDDWLRVDDKEKEEDNLDKIPECG
ncbi:MAG: DUF3892 domain-containing protein [Halobacteriales archaeon]|nr:DUF3892 domain-containing protein [Halobacteriales archaeon]